MASPEHHDQDRAPDADPPHDAAGSVAPKSAPTPPAEITMPSRQRREAEDLEQVEAIQRGVERAEEVLGHGARGEREHECMPADDPQSFDESRGRSTGAARAARQLPGADREKRDRRDDERDRVDEDREGRARDLHQRPGEAGPPISATDELCESFALPSRAGRRRRGTADTSDTRSGRACEHASRNATA